MAKKPTTDESTDDQATSSTAASETATPVVAADPQPVVVAAPTSSRSRWVLTSIAAVGLLGLGLLGGILIGQQVGISLAQDHKPASHITIEHQQSGKGERLPDRLSERLRERRQDMRDHRQGQPGQPQPTPSTTAPGGNG